MAVSKASVGGCWVGPLLGFLLFGCALVVHGLTLTPSLYLLNRAFVWFTWTRRRECGTARAGSWPSAILDRELTWLSLGSSTTMGAL